MRKHLLLAALVMSGAVAAQNQFGTYPDQCGVCVGAGEVDATNVTTVFGPGITADHLTKYNMANFRGVGQTRQTPGGPIQGVLTGAIVTVQDENPSTPHSFNFVVLRDNPTSPGRPDPGPMGTLFTLGAVTPTASSTQPTAFTATYNFATPFTGLPQNNTFYFGLNFTASSTQTDGMSVWSSTYFPQPASGLGPIHDNPRAGAPSLTWYVQRSATSTPTVFEGNVPFQWIQNFHMLVGGSSLVVGADVAMAQRPQGFVGQPPVFTVAPNPNFGVAGQYPATVARRDGTALLVRDQANPNAPGAIWLSTGPTPFAPIAFPFTNGNIHLNPLTIITLPAGLNAQGRLQVTLFPQGSAPINRIASIGGGTLAFQFIGLTAQLQIAISNLAGVSYQ